MAWVVQGQARPRRQKHLADRHQRLRQRLGVQARDGAEEKELQQFVILQRRGAGFNEALAQALAVFMVVRFGLERRRLAGATSGRRR